MGTEIEQVYAGDILGVWQDNERIFVDFYSNGCTLIFTFDEWEMIKTELTELLMKDVKNIQ